MTQKMWLLSVAISLIAVFINLRAAHVGQVNTRVTNCWNRGGLMCVELIASISYTSERSIRQCQDASLIRKASSLPKGTLIKELA